jgi:hypothetical protein
VEFIPNIAMKTRLKIMSFVEYTQVLWRGHDNSDLLVAYAYFGLDFVISAIVPYLMYHLLINVFPSLATMFIYTSYMVSIAGVVLFLPLLLIVCSYLLYLLVMLPILVLVILSQLKDGL